MKKYLCLLMLIQISTLLFAQDVIIGGNNKNRLLNWNDFTGTPDQNSSHDANTYWDINYSLKGISFKGDTAKISGFAVTLSLNETLSWIKPEKKTDGLLKHEQGHFNLGLLCQREIISQLNSVIFFRSDFQQKIQSIFSSVFDKYRLLGIQYDKETDHSKDKDAQNNWNDFFDKELNR